MRGSQEGKDLRERYNESTQNSGEREEYVCGVDGIVIGVLKNEGIRIIDWLLMIVNRYMESGVVPEDYTRVYGIAIQRVR